MKLVDTTLRDGEQCPEIVFSPSDKIKLALLLDEIGIYEIEAGIYDANTEGSDYIREIIAKKKQAKISLWSRLNPKDVEEAAIQKPDLIHIGTPISFSQIYNKIGKNKDWVENTLNECIEVAKGYRIPVTVGLEDATRADIGFMMRIIQTVERLGVETVRIADTVGVLFPKRAIEIAQAVKRSTSVQIEIHEHNDFGMAVANSLVMAASGADMVDVTLLGMGERAGNCDMYEFVHAANRKFELIKGKDVRRAEELLRNIISGGTADDL